MPEEIVTRFADGKLIVDYCGKPQSNYTTGGVSHRFNKLSRVEKVLFMQVQGTPYRLEAVEYGTGNVIKIKMYDISAYTEELSSGATITPLTFDIRVIGY
ncbi:MAG: hypothetical protein K6T73_03400 [Candidatus Bathyarchaeota archaeon]|nr:hypothetical protein [Candidatus Bathyarchaeota archaeon]